MRVNYTTYDMRRDQDSLNPRTQADVMLLAHEDLTARNSHPYWYARMTRHTDSPLPQIGQSQEHPRVFSLPFHAGLKGAPPCMLYLFLLG